MKTISASQVCYTDTNFDITDIFPENWVQRKEFSLYKTNPRASSALFFICSDIEVSFFLPDGTKTITVRMGDVVFIPQGICYYARVCGNTGLKTDTFTINLHFYDSQRQKFLLSEHIDKISCCKDTRMELSLKRLSDTFHRDRRNLAKSRGELLLLLDLVCSCITRNDDFYYRIRKGAELFCKEWNKNEKIEKYAQMCDVSVTYFHRCFKKWSGSSPVEYRNALRLSNAESLLRCTDIKIKEISEMIGYKDPYYFCRLFTDTYGLSPRNYRKCHQKE